MSDYPTLLAVGGAALAALLLPRLIERLKLSRAKHRSLAGHARMAKRIAGLLPFYEYDEAQIFRVDGAPPRLKRAAVGPSNSLRRAVPSATRRGSR